MNRFDLETFRRERSNAIVVDVLPRESYRVGHIPNAINLPHDEIEQLAPTALPDLNARIIVYCGGPECPLGDRAAHALAELGYTHIDEFTGGLEAWNAAGLSLIRELRPLGSDPEVNRILRIVDQLTIRQWGLTWVSFIFGSGLVYWLASVAGHPVLKYREGFVPSGLRGFADSLYFSAVTASTVGYGDITPVGWARWIATAEAVSGVILVGVLISKMVSSHQERLIRETHDLTVRERLGRIQTSLHLLVNEFQSMAMNDSPKAQELIALRFTSATMLLQRDLVVVRNLLHESRSNVEESVMESILVTLHATLSAFIVAREVCVSGTDHDQFRRAQILGGLVEQICAKCVPQEHSDQVNYWMDRIHQLASVIRTVGGSTAKLD